MKRPLVDHQAFMVQYSKTPALGVNLSVGARGAAPSLEGGWPVRTGGGGECDAEVASITSEEQRRTPSLEEELLNGGASAPPRGDRAPCAASSPPTAPAKVSHPVRARHGLGRTPTPPNPPLLTPVPTLSQLLS